MLNRASHLLHPRGHDAGLWDSARKVERKPGLRLALLYGVMLLLLIGVAWRLSHVQLTLSDTFAAEFERTIVKLEPLAASPGRILAADGEVLAEDERLLGLKVHYRWLELSPQEDWLRQQARAGLSRSERRDPARVAAGIEQARTAVAEMWERLARLTGTPAAELSRRRGAIQARVERMRAAVLARRAAQAPAAADVELITGDALWARAARGVIHALTTPPVREAEEPFVLQEELEYHPLLEGISVAQAAEIESRRELYPGVRIVTSSRRTYPRGDVAPHVVGVRVPLDADDIAERRARFPQGDPLDYQIGDWVGKSGLERYYERHLRGLRGMQRVVLNRRGEVLRTEVIRRPREGRDIVLALHLSLQQHAERLLDEALTGGAAAPEGAEPAAIPQGGCIVVLDVRTGEVLAAASAPRYDLRLLAGADRAGWAAVLADQRRPLFPRVTQMTLPPGSVFKTLTATALLQLAQFDPDAPVHCQGYLDHPRSHRCYTFTHFGTGHGGVDLTAALAQSCNVYFFTAARRSGPQPLCDWAQRFGFGQPTGIDLPGESSGHLPLPPKGGTVAGQRRTWFPGETLGLAIGQASLTVTPLQVARLMAAVANGGALVTPRLVRGSGPALLTSPGEISAEDELSTLPEPTVIPELRAGTLERVREGLRQVVADPRGTGYKTVRLREIGIAGKTGTAETGGRPDHAWFAGYVPADRPRYAFVVVLEHAGSGGRVAGPVARELVRGMLAQGLLEPAGDIRRTASAE